jgi:hypothetical protein
MNFFFVLKAFLKGKNKHVLIRKFNPTSNEKQYHHPFFVQYKKNLIYLFSLYYMKKKITLLDRAGGRTQL